MPCIQTAITNHFKMFFRDVSDETFYEIHNRQGLLHILIVFMAVIVESNSISIIPVNPGCGNDGSAKIATNIFGNGFRIAEIGLGIDIEAVFVLSVAFCFYFFKGRPYFVFHFIEKSRAESIAQIVVVKVLYMAPEAVVTVAAFGKETVNVGIPFEIAAKRMKDHDIAGSKIFGMVQIEKHPRYYTGDGMEETVQERSVLKKKGTEIFINGKNAMAVLDTNEFERHTGGAIHSIFVATGRAKTAVTVERNEFEVRAVRTRVHGTAKRRITAVDHLIDIFHLSFSGMKSIFNFFIMVCKDSL